MHVLGREEDERRATGTPLPTVRLGSFLARDGSAGAAVGVDADRPHAGVVFGKRGTGKMPIKSRTWGDRRAWVRRPGGRSAGSSTETSALAAVVPAGDDAGRAWAVPSQLVSHITSRTRAMT